MSFYPIAFHVIPVQDNKFATTPVPANARIVLHAVPPVPLQAHEVTSVAVVCEDQLAVDATNDVLVGTIKQWDQSASSGSGADLTAIFTGAAAGAGDLLTAVLDLKVIYQLWNGNVTLDPGDHLDAILATTTPDTAGLGYFFIVCYRVKNYLGQI